MKRLFSYVYFEILNSRADSALDSVELLCFFSVLLLCDFACDECELLGQTWNCYDFYFSEQLLDLTLALCGVAGYADEEAALYIIDLQQVQFFLAPAHHDVSAFVLCAVYNIGNSNPENLLDFVQILSEELVRAGVLPADYDFDAHKELVPMQPGDVPVTYADTTALERDFGFKPHTPLREGLRKFAEWYKEFYIA